MQWPLISRRMVLGMTSVVRRPHNCGVRRWPRWAWSMSSLGGRPESDRFPCLISMHARISADTVPDGRFMAGPALEGKGTQKM